MLSSILEAVSRDYRVVLYAFGIQLSGGWE